MKYKFTAFLFLFQVFLFTSCHKDEKEQLVRKWKMRNEDFYLEIRKDGSYIYNEHNNRRTGHWEYKENHLLYLEGESFTIKKLDDRRLLLSTGNGDEMDFQAD